MSVLAMDRKEIAETILKNLGGRRFIVMTGSANFAHDKNGSLSFKVGKNDMKITHVKVTLNDLDLYDVSFYKIRGTNVKEEVVTNLYAEDLQAKFTEKTGLYTKL